MRCRKERKGKERRVYRRLEAHEKRGREWKQKEKR